MTDQENPDSPVSARESRRIACDCACHRLGSAMIEADCPCSRAERMSDQENPDSPVSERDALREAARSAARKLYAAEVHRQGVGWDAHCTDLLVRAQHELVAALEWTPTESEQCAPESDSSPVCEHGVPESLGDCEMCKWDRELANAQATDDDEIWYTDE